MIKILLSLEDDMAAELDMAAARDERTRQSYIRAAIREKLERINTPNAPAGPQTTANLVGRPPKADKPLDIQEGAAFKLTPAKLKALQEWPAVTIGTHPEDRGMICTARFAISASTGLPISDAHEMTSVLCSPAELRQLAPALQKMIADKMKLYIPARTRDEIRAKADNYNPAA